MSPYYVRTFVYKLVQITLIVLFTMANRGKKTLKKEAPQLKKIDKKKYKDKKLLCKKKKKRIIKKKEENSPPSTVSIAVPGSILNNAQTPILRAYIAGQIARAACIFQVDEIIVYNNYAEASDRSCVQLARILEFVECPPFLRKHLLPVREDLNYVGLSNPLDAQHHLRLEEEFSYREGFVTNKPVKKGVGCFVDIGLLKEARVDTVVSPGLRVTVELVPAKAGYKKHYGRVVAPTVPRAKTGVYWGYKVRVANSLTEVFSKSSYSEGYDLLVGTSHKGTSVDELSELKYDHLLIVFGGFNGLEVTILNDPDVNAKSPDDLFDHYLNTLPNQGSRTITTEEAILVSLAAIRSKLAPKVKVKQFIAPVIGKKVNLGPSNTKKARHN